MLVLKIGAITIGISGLNGQAWSILPPVYSKFISRSKPAAWISLRQSRDLRCPPHLRTINRSGLLNIHSAKRSGFCFSFKQSPGYGTIDIRKRTCDYVAPALGSVPLGILIETFYNTLLNGGVFDGLMLHACGVRDQGKGYVFAAESGGGKSTVGKIALGSGKHLLNDDRIIVRPVGRRPWMFGNPWHGEVVSVEDAGTGLDKIFFLKKGGANRAVRLDPATAAVTLMSNLFILPFDQQVKRTMFHRCVELTGKVPAYELTFYPDGRIWREIERSTM